MNWTKFYTPKAIANEIISMIPESFIPDIAIDICVGSGNFLNAAADYWKDVKLVGFDIDTSLVQKEGKRQYQLNELNALKINDLNKSKFKFKGNKIVLANPPFGNFQKNFDQCCGTLHVELSKEAVKLQRIEALMLVSNLCLMENGDYFGAVIPENFFSSHTFKKFKILFLSCFTDIRIGKPQEYFNKSEVRTRTFVGKYHKEKLAIINTPLVKSINKSELCLKRGVDNSKLKDVYSESMVEVLHFTNRKGIILNRKFVTIKACQKDQLVKTGDTLIIRVGRNSGLVFGARKMYVNKYISDYFYLLKGDKLSSKEKEELSSLLIKNASGLTTKYLKKTLIEASIQAIIKKR